MAEPKSNEKDAQNAPPANGEPEKDAAPKKRSGKLLLISRTGQDRNRGTYVVPADKPLVLDLGSVDDEHLGALEADPAILSLRTDSPLTPKAEIRRVK